MLTPMQSAALSLIDRHQVEGHGVTPTYREMAVLLGLKSTSSIHRLVLALEERGFIRRLPKRHQAIEILRRVA